MAFRLRTDDGPTLNAGLVALWFVRGSEPVLLRNPIFWWFFRGGGGPDSLSPTHELICVFMSLDIKGGKVMMLTPCHIHYFDFRSCCTVVCFAAVVVFSYRFLAKLVVVSSLFWGAQWLSGRECLTLDRGAAGSSLTDVTVLWSLSKTHLSLLSSSSTQEEPSLFNWEIVDGT